MSYEIQVKPPAEFPGAIQTIVNTAMLDTNQTPPVGASAEIDIIGDNVAPTTTATITPDPNAAGWHKTDVQVTLSATDNPDGSGVSQIVYSIDGNQTIGPRLRPASHLQATASTRSRSMPWMAP